MVKKIWHVNLPKSKKYSILQTKCHILSQPPDAAAPQETKTIQEAAVRHQGAHGGTVIDFTLTYFLKMTD